MASTTGRSTTFVSKFTKGYKWQPTKIVYEATDEDLTAAGGIGNIVDLFVESPQFEKFRESLPLRQSNASYDTAQFGLTALSSFWFDHECIDDGEEFLEDPGVSVKLDGVPSPRAMGDWLRDFTEDNTARLNQFLISQSLSMRKKLSAPDAPIVIDMDSTAHVQTGTKMEGLAYNYKNEWCLDSLVAFDDLGFAYNMDLRPGNTFSAQGAPAMIDRIFGAFKKNEWAKTKDRMFRGDSAFCNKEVIRACIQNEAKFTITAHGNTGWEAEAKGAPDEVWTEWVYSDSEIMAAAKKRRELPKRQVLQFLYQPGWSKNLRFTIVVKRTWVDYEQGNLFEGQGYWDHYAVLTNLSLYKYTPQSIMEHHSARGNSENFIREAKYGYDLKHFPCKKMRANHAYGMLALVAHNFYRAMSLVDNPGKPGYSKRLRRKLVYIPAKLIKHARTLTMKVPLRFMKEVHRIREAWRAPPIIPSPSRLRLYSQAVQVL